MFKSKILTKKDYDALTAKAANYDKIVATVVESNPGINAEDVSFETIQELMQNDSSDDTDPELQSKFDNLQADYNTVINERDNLQTQVTNLLNTAGEDPGSISSGSEVTGKEDSLSQFAKKNAGNTAAILEKCKEEGII